MTRFLSLMMITAFMFATPGLAAEEKKADTAKSEESQTPTAKANPAPKQEITPVTKWMDAENKMIEPLNSLDMESVYIMRQKYSVIKAVGVAEKDIGNGVKSCGKANPDLKTEIGNRFEQWKKAINPVVDLAYKNLMTEIEKQTIVSAADFKKVLKLQDEAYEYGEKRTVKNYATSKDACEGLLESMNDTEDDLVQMLQDTLLPPSVIKSRVEKAKSEAEKKKSFTKNPQ